jgi:subtilase family serine protease
MPKGEEIASIRSYLELHGINIYSSTGNSPQTGTAVNAVQALQQFNQKSMAFETAQTFNASSSQPVDLYGKILTPYGYMNITSDLNSRRAVPMYMLGQKVSNPMQTSSNFLSYTPSDIEEMYNTTSLLNEGVNGSGITIAIVDAYGDPYIQQELNYFSSYYGIPTTNITIINVGSPINYTMGILTGWNIEIALDVEWAHAMAPGANIELYVAANSGPALSQAVEDAILGTNGTITVPKPNIISLSWGIPENDIGSSAAVAPVYGLNYPWLDQVFQQAAARGITVFASAGDWGAYDQAFGQTSPYGGAIYPSTDPFVTGVGGTTLYMQTSSGYLQYPFTNATGTYGTETAWSWNNLWYWGTGGGYSSIFGRPYWQHGEGVPVTGPRGAPDVAWDADVQTGVTVYVNGAWWIVGGTSVGAPSWAGSMALIDQRAGQSLGYINPYLYTILNNQTLYSKAFHDITVGDNNPYQASKGWDPLTGVGSPNIGELSAILPQVASSGIKVGVELAPNGRQLNASQSVAYGSTVQIIANITKDGAAVSNGTVTAQVSTSTGATVASNIPLKYNNSTKTWIGEVNISSSFQPGEWTVTVSASSNGASGEGFASFEVGDGVTIFEPILEPSYPYFTNNQVIPISAVITAPNGSPVTSGSFNAIFTYDTPNGPVQGEVPLTYNSTDGMWEGSFLIPINCMQGPWVMTVNGTDSNGNLGSAYTWLNVGAYINVFTDSPSYVLGDTIYIVVPSPSNFYPTNIGTVNATVSYDGEVLGTVPLTYYSSMGEFIGSFQTNSSDPTGFYTITANGQWKDWNNNVEAGSASTVVRVAPYTLLTKVTVSYPEINESYYVGNNEIISAKLSYPNGTPVTMGNVAAMVSIGAEGDELYTYYLTLTYNNATKSFINPSQVPIFQYGLPLIGNYSIYVTAYDPWGNYGTGTGSFTVLGESHSPITITNESQFNSANGVISGNGSASNPYVIAFLNVSSIKIAGNFSSYYELYNNWVQGSKGSGVVIDTPNAEPSLEFDYFLNNNGSGLYLNNTSDSTILDSISASNAQNGFTFVNSSGSYMFDNYATNNAQNGMLLLNSCYSGAYSTIESNALIMNGGSGLNMTSTKYGNIYSVGNLILGNNIGIYVNGMDQKSMGWDNGSTQYSIGDYIQGNNIGILAQNNAIIVSVGDTITGNLNGLVANTSTVGIFWTNFVSNLGNGMLLNGKASDKVLVPEEFFGIGNANYSSIIDWSFFSDNGNQSSGEGSGAVIMNENDMFIANENFYNNVNNGLKLINISNSKLVWIWGGNNGMNGIELTGASYNNLTNIWGWNNGMNGIELTGASYNNLTNIWGWNNGFSGLAINGANSNNIHNGNSAFNLFGVLIANGSTYNNLTGTWIENNNAGIGFVNSSNNTATNNGLYGNIAAIYLSNGSDNNYMSNHFSGNEIDIYTLPALDNSFSATSINETTIGTNEAINATFTSKLIFDQPSIIWFEVDNASTGQEILVVGTSLDLAPLQSGSAYLPLKTLPPGNYTVYAFAETRSGIPISPVLEAHVNVK